MTELRRLGFLLVLGVFLADRLSKWWIVEVYDLPARGSVPVLPFLDLSMVWNQGMSMGLFRADSDAARYALIAVTGAVAIGLAIWIWRAKEKFLVLALGLVVGGAAGNIWDRFAYGAVADFIHLHALGYSFFVFNLADSAISIGVAMLLWDALLSTQKTNT
ncbi:MAG: signal peptidase II [Proteobacteria bacterium]|nr:signal peptidase II [Pseudomonadota bacterium]